MTMAYTRARPLQAGLHHCSQGRSLSGRLGAEARDLMDLAKKAARGSRAAEGKVRGQQLRREAAAEVYLDHVERCEECQ